MGIVVGGGIGVGVGVGVGVGGSGGGGGGGVGVGVGGSGGDGDGVGVIVVVGGGSGGDGGDGGRDGSYLGLNLITRFRLVQLLSGNYLKPGDGLYHPRGKKRGRDDSHTMIQNKSNQMFLERAVAQFTALHRTCYFGCDVLIPGVSIVQHNHEIAYTKATRGVCVSGRLATH